MKIKVYNEKGKIRITKVVPGYMEQTIFSDLQDGEMAEINVEVANLYLTAEKEKICDE